MATTTALGRRCGLHAPSRACPLDSVRRAPCPAASPLLLPRQHQHLLSGQPSSSVACPALRRQVQPVYFPDVYQGLAEKIAQGRSLPKSGEPQRERPRRVECIRLFVGRDAGGVSKAGGEDEGTRVGYAPHVARPRASREPARDGLATGVGGGPLQWAVALPNNQTQHVGDGRLVPCACQQGGIVQEAGSSPAGQPCLLDTHGWWGHQHRPHPAWPDGLLIPPQLSGSSRHPNHRHFAARRSNPRVRTYPPTYYTSPHFHALR